jgi:hypothetical protein
MAPRQFHRSHSIVEYEKASRGQATTIEDALENPQKSSKSKSRRAVRQFVLGPPRTTQAALIGCSALLSSGLRPCSIQGSAVTSTLAQPTGSKPKPLRRTAQRCTQSTMFSSSAAAVAKRRQPFSCSKRIHPLTSCFPLYRMVMKRILGAMFYLCKALHVDWNARRFPRDSQLITGFRLNLPQHPYRLVYQIADP